MKLRNLFAALPGILMISPISAPLCSAAAANKAPIIYNAEERDVKFYDIGSNGVGYVYSPIDASIKMTHFNDSSIGYLDIDWYVNAVTPDYNSKTTNNVTVITNKINKATATIDFRNQKLTFSDYDLFKDSNPYSPSPLTISGGGEKYYSSIEVKQYLPGKAYVIDLEQYHIPAIFYKGKGYLPYEFMRNILDVQAVMYGQYNGKGIYKLSSGNNEALLPLLAQIRKESNIFNEDYMEYTYNLLALTLDLRFGISERSSRSNPGEIIKFKPNGAYDILAPYHDRLVSTEDDVSNEALKDLFTNDLDDGGHTRYSSLNAFSTKCFTPLSNYGKETKHTFDTFDKMGKARKNAKCDIASYWQSQGDQAPITAGADCYYKEYTEEGKSPIAYITFDSFKADDENTFNQDERKAQRALPSNTNENNYWSDTIRLTMFANEQIKQHNVKNLVVDLTNNGGGAAYSEFFIASWLCGGVTEKMCNPVTGAFCEYTVKADVDGNGAFDENDYLAEDVNLYLITSSGSFSCGNLLPCNVNDNKPNATIIGEKSGGGCCAVDSNLYSGTGSLLRTSSSFQIQRLASTPNKHITNDAGCEVQVHLDESQPEQFFDRENINQKIWSK